jgi:ATP-dependent Clp protease ATP-binding subunit ClpB
VIQRHLQDPLAELLLSGEVKDGDTVSVTAGPEGLSVGGHSAAARPEEKPLGSALH